MENSELYRHIARRTGGDVYIGVVGPVRTGKSTFIKRFMELMVLPQIDSPAFAQRARDELPQSAAGRTIMTTEPKFVPEQAVTIRLDDGASLRTRLIDCVGYMVPGAMGHREEQKPRMVKSPWFEEEVPFDVAAETGTRKVICEHSTIGLVVTTDGSISDIPRADYEQAEQRVIAELEAIRKPYVILLNCVRPDTIEALSLAEELSEKYGRPVLPVSCMEMERDTVHEILKRVLYEFPLREVAFAMPAWVPMLQPGHWLQSALYDAVRAWAAGLGAMKDAAAVHIDCPYLASASLRGMDLGQGSATVALQLAPEIFYRVLSEQTGLEVVDEAGLMPCIIQLARAKQAYDRLAPALEEVQATGYGIVMPAIDELRLEEPEIVRQGGRYGVRLRASAPSIHLLRADIATEVSPIVGTERQSEELVASLLKDFEANPSQIWQSNIFGKSLHELVNEGLQNKLLHMPAEARARMQETVQRVINEGCTGLICIIL